MNDMDRQQEVYRSLIGRNDTVFDVGANIGNRSAVFQSLCKKVIAVEPQIILAEQLKCRFKDSNVTVVNEAVGAHPGIGKMFIPSDGSLGRHGVGTLSREFQQAMGPKVFNLDKGWDTEQTVHITTLDNLITWYGLPSFIKLDIEGYELQAVQGLSQKINALSFEFHPQLFQEAREITLRLELLGFTEFNYCLAEEFQWKMDRWKRRSDLLDDIYKYVGDDNIYGDCYAR